MSHTDFASLYNTITKIFTHLLMTEELLHSYRLTSMEEPTDELLHALMEKVAEDIRETTKRVQNIHHKRLSDIAAKRGNRIVQCK